MDEESPTEPQSYSGKRLLEGECGVLGSTFSATVLRLGGIYGPGRTGAIDGALRQASEEKIQAIKPTASTATTAPALCAT